MFAATLSPPEEKVDESPARVGVVRMASEHASITALGELPASVPCETEHGFVVLRLARPECEIESASASMPLVASDAPGQVVAVGLQVGISNGSLVENDRVVEMRLPRSWLARFQIVEYMRSFAQGRVAFAALDSLLILSGVFALMRRDIVLAIGGFLTKGMRTRIGIEYCGEGAHTVCEDMEIVVRRHRHLLDRELSGRIDIFPLATCLTYCPENIITIGKQRSRWYRDLLEVLAYHPRGHLPSALQEHRTLLAPVSAVLRGARALRWRWRSISG